MSLTLVTAFLSELLIIAEIVVLFFFISRIGKFLVRILFTFLLNAILGIASVLALNSALGIGIAFGAPVLLSSVLFGLPAVGTMIILKLAGLALI